MTPDAFRKLALALPGAAEGAHMGHTDFRVRGKIFATLGYPHAGVATLLLTPDEQLHYERHAPDSFRPVKGGWGRKGKHTRRAGRGGPSHCAERFARRVAAQGGALAATLAVEPKRGSTCTTAVLSRQSLAFTQCSSARITARLGFGSADVAACAPTACGFEQLARERRHLLVAFPQA
jgi:hypothetical protein